MLTLAHLQQRRSRRWLFGLTLLLLVTLLISLCAGEQWIPPGEWLSAKGQLFIWQIRLPRTLAVLLVGAALALSGAIMQALFENPLAEPGLLGVSNGAGVRTTALLTDMNQVLASSAGNAVEVREAVQFLTGEYRNPRLFDVTMALCVEMLISGKLAADDAEARAKLQAVLDNGKAAEVFGRMVAAQKGPSDFVENYANYLPTAMLSKAVYADTEGFISAMDTRALGMAVVSMGGGRRQASDTIDYSVGFTEMARLGDRVDGQRPLAVIHAKDENSWQEAAKAVKAAIKLDDKAPEITPTVYRRITE